MRRVKVRVTLLWQVALTGAAEVFKWLDFHMRNLHVNSNLVYSLRHNCSEQSIMDRDSLFTFHMPAGHGLQI